MVATDSLHLVDPPRGQWMIEAHSGVDLHSHSDVELLGEVYRHLDETRIRAGDDSDESKTETVCET